MSCSGWPVLWRSGWVAVAVAANAPAPPGGPLEPLCEDAHGGRRR